MDELKMLGVALGLASLAGLNLYLTVFVTGLALRMEWVTLPAQMADLSVLGDPIIIGVAGVLYLIEFVADKIPWVDTAWDSVHTFIRPVGAAAIAVAALGSANPVFEIVAALLAGSMALTTHAAKASTRLVANGSPEPVSNIALSVGEDVIVLAGLGLIAWNPIVALVVAFVASGLIVTFLPRMLRGVRAHLWFAWRKLSALPEGKKVTQLENGIPRPIEKWLRQAHAGSEPILWATFCLSNSGPNIPANLGGYLIQLEGGKVFFIARKLGGHVTLALDTHDATIAHTQGFLADTLEITHHTGKPVYRFHYERGHTLLAAQVAENLRGQASLTPKPQLSSRDLSTTVAPNT